ncbi:hypothetical protein [Deinococcus fonticola]|uniref:hypothetical protein n=1 Tax=Deinococcus fonticola TaxID=2528713 RepID=UPI001074A5AC|nr:hypothetical protein [Deinococcus fonticola]
MHRTLLTILCFSLGASGVGGATNVDFGVTYPLTARVGVSDWPALGGTVAAGVSTRGVDVSYARGLSLPPLGALNTSVQAQVAWAGGFRVASATSGALGPVALSLSGTYFTASAATFDPLAGWTLAPTDLRGNGWNADLGVRYRVNRNLVALLGTELGGPWNVYGGVEQRRDLTRTLPRAEGDDPDAPLETETTGTLSYRLGARAGTDVLGATAGFTYTTADGRAFALDAQVGPERGGHSGLGLVASVSFADVLGENSRLRTYAAYEPWRWNTNPLRAGVEITKPVGPGTLKLDLRGGLNQAGETGFGAAASYSFPLGQAEQEP